MGDLSPSTEEREFLVKRYELYRDALAQIIREMDKTVSTKRIALVLKDLHLSFERATLVANERVRASVYDYAMFADRRKGRTVFEGWLDEYRRRSNSPRNPIRQVVDAMATARYSVFEIEEIHQEFGLTVRDVLTTDRRLVLDRLMSTRWKEGDQCGCRLAVMPEFAMFLGEPIEADVSPGDDYTGKFLNPTDQTKLHAAIIQWFCEAVRPC